MTKLRPLTQTEHDVIRAYAREHGRYWKASLRDDWMNARTTGIMQALRNSHGPSWLVSFSLPRDQSLAGPVRVVSVTADNGDLFEATMMGADAPWIIAYTEKLDFSCLSPALCSWDFYLRRSALSLTALSVGWIWGPLLLCPVNSLRSRPLSIWRDSLKTVRGS